MTDQVIVKKFIEGDIDAFESIYNACYPKAYYFALKFIGNAATSQDLVQDVFLSLWESKESLNPEKPVEPYIMVSVKNKCLNHLRDSLSKIKASQSLQKKALTINLQALQQFNNSTFDTIATDNLREHMNTSLSKMPEKTRDAFVLNRFNNMSYQQIATKHGVSERNIEYRINDALRKLKEDLKDFLNEDF